MERDACLKMIVDGYRAMFDVRSPCEICGRDAAAYCFFSSRSEKYVFSRKAVIWSANMFEHVVVADVRAERFSAGEVSDAAAFLADMERALVRPDSEHMYTALTLLLLCGGRDVDAGAVKMLRRTRFERRYLWSWHGYASGRLVAIHLPANEVFSNAAGRPVAAFYRRKLGAITKEQYE